MDELAIILRGNCQEIEFQTNNHQQTKNRLSCHVEESGDDEKKDECESKRPGQGQIGQMSLNI